MEVMDYVLAWRRSPCGERGLKSGDSYKVKFNFRRSPCGERGLKFETVDLLAAFEKSLPMRGAWIEISTEASVIRIEFVAPHAGSVD